MIALRRHVCCSSFCLFFFLLIFCVHFCLLLFISCFSFVGGGGGAGGAVIGFGFFVNIAFPLILVLFLKVHAPCHFFTFDNADLRL